MSNKIEATGRFYVHTYSKINFCIVSPSGRTHGVFLHTMEEAQKECDKLNKGLSKMHTKRLILRNCLDCPNASAILLLERVVQTTIGAKP